MTEPSNKTIRNVMIDLGPSAFFLLIIWMQTLNGQPASEKELVRASEMSKYKVGQALQKLETRGWSTLTGNHWIIGDNIRQLSFFSFSNKLEPVIDISSTPLPNETEQPEQPLDAEKKFFSPDTSPEKKFSQPEPESLKLLKQLKQLSESVVNKDFNLTTDSLNSHELAEKIFSASKELFGEKITARREFKDQAQQLLAWTAQIYDTRDQLKTHKYKKPRPARVVYRNLVDSKQPEDCYLETPLDFLPTWFVDEIGLGDFLERCPACQHNVFSDCVCETCPHCQQPTGNLCKCERCPECQAPLWQCGDCRKKITATERCETRWDNGSNMAPAQAWNAALEQIQTEMPKAAFDTWVRSAELVDADPDKSVFRIAVQNSYAKDWLESRLTSIVTRLLTGIMNQNIQVEFVTSP